MPVLENTFRVAVFDEFLDAFARLPRAQQKNAQKFLMRFRADPTSHAINLEKIASFADQNLRTVRIDEAYRAIVLKPETGNVFVLLWVDHHDKAMAWARNKRVVVHPETGTLQVLVAAPAVAPPAEPVPASAPALFEGYSDADLLGLGLHPDHLARVRAVHTLAALDGLIGELPTEAWEALFFLGSGEPLEAVRQALAVDRPAAVDVEDIGAALATPGSQRSFRVVTDDAELDAMLDAPLDKWRIFLHPSQRKLVTRPFSGPARVLGGAGTGKTVVAMHRAVHLASNVFSGEHDRILFTTFTRNLAADIQASLRRLCPPRVAERIEVVPLDKWVADFLHRSGYKYKLAYWPSEPLETLWSSALALAPTGFAEGFFREEWDNVVQPHGCATGEEYARAARAGRGVRLSRGQRKEIWPVFEEYRRLLEAHGLRESVDAMRDAAVLLEKRGPTHGPYRAVVVDEAQDMSTLAFRMIRAMLPQQADDLFIVGDGHQRIYRHRVVLSRAGVHITGRSRKLYINYRTTDEIRAFGVALLLGVAVDDLDGAVDDNARYKSLVHGAAPVIGRCATFAEEVERLKAFVLAGDPARTCLVARTSPLLEQYRSALEKAGIPTYVLRRSVEERAEEPGLRLATMHRVKGLEFDRVAVAGVNDGVVPLELGDLRSSDSAVRAEAEGRERALLYVAVTRARREVLLTSHGKPSRYLP
jgi:hypothetical protein